LIFVRIINWIPMDALTASFSLFQGLSEPGIWLLIARVQSRKRMKAAAF